MIKTFCCCDSCGSTIDSPSCGLLFVGNVLCAPVENGAHDANINGGFIGNNIDDSGHVYRSLVYCKDCARRILEL